MKIQKWVNRDFDFSFTIEKFPFILERLNGTAARIEELVKDLPPSKLLYKNGNDWSIQEHIGHLIDLDELHDGRIDDFLAGLPQLRPADMTNKKTYEANHNAAKTEMLLQKFRKERMHFISRLEKTDPALLSLHPRLQKPMRVIDMAFFVAEHDDHHLSLMRLLSRDKL